MQIPNISLAYLVTELRPVVEGSVLRKVQELSNNWLKIRLQTREGTKDLIATPDALFMTSYSMPAKHQSSGYGAFLRKQLSNKKLLSLEQHGFDRILVMRFQDFSLIFELFAKGNVILVDKEMRILSAFRKEQWKDRTLRKGHQYNFPSSKGASPTGLDLAQLKGAIYESSTDVVRTLVKQVNIAPIFAEEACLRTGVEKEKPSASLSEKEIIALVASIKQLHSVSAKKSSPVLVEKASEEILLPFPVETPGRTLQTFKSVNEAIDSIYSERFSRAGYAKETAAAERKKAELGRSMQRQHEALKELQLKAELNKEKAELIYSNYSGLFELQQALNQMLRDKIQEKEIMYKLKRRFPFLISINTKTKKAVVSLPDIN